MLQNYRARVAEMAPNSECAGRIVDWDVIEAEIEGIGVLRVGVSG